MGGLSEQKLAFKNKFAEPGTVELVTSKVP